MKSLRQRKGVQKGANKLSALDKLTDLRDGKRKRDFNFDKEQALYDEVDDEEYAKIMDKQRQETGRTDLVLVK